ncbi:YbaK/EbsC family protein [Catellatospora tritici]|uniref:YbaK/EbsC family protein n=1 Tax=Catellatospora tritici TaxID=2851566 RepID=UPI001C2D3400|nr:YbaK/EbsC family protein [Catellatospora tritici]MBV1850843.1 YbaK/EbsC family protein [Catellatospora tritici]MBV1851096.1 YbaK/EbsC family protein [Catellatospora tritici]
MSAAPIGKFEAAWPAVTRSDLVAAPVAAALSAWTGVEPVESVLVVDTDPDLADTGNFGQAYAVEPHLSANCVVVAAKRGETVTYAACMVLASTRADVNGLARRHLGARKASFAPMDEAVTLTGMQYGGITPIGLPDSWPVLVDAAVADTPYVVIGSGNRRGKLIVPGKVLAGLPGATVLEALGV